jgi:phosphomannomutase
MLLVDAATVQRAQEWSRRDPNETTAAYVQNLIQTVQVKSEESSSQSAQAEATAAAAAAASSELKSLFPDDSQRISFGTAGLRSAMKPGPTGMNDLVVLQTAQGLARYCLQQQQQQQQQQQLQKPSVVVGYDHRSNTSMQLSSLSFALLTALVFIEAGFDCFLLDGFVATPLVPYALGQTKNCAAGIMITASHNPKQDAGYKVYWNDGCQIRSPLDQEIAQTILEPANLEPWVDYREQLRTRRAQYGNAVDVDVDPCLGLSRPKETQEMIASYFSAIQASGLVSGRAAQLLLSRNTNGHWKPPAFVYTAMHGVGYPFALQSFEIFGMEPFHSVPTQQEPDPAFSTVPFPNPEEKGAMDAAKAHAVSKGCDVVLANDPDADRLAVAEKSRVTGEWTTFTGDEIGTMLGHWLWQQQQQRDADADATATTTTTTTKPPLAMCASTVSSKMLAEIARVEGFHFEDTLTGFKWIGSRAAELNRSGQYRSIFCYEEAIGFCCGDVIFDKDGISALGVFADLAVSVYCTKHMQLQDHMQSLYDKYGEFVSRNGYFFMNDPIVVSIIMGQMTSQGTFSELLTERAVGAYKVASFRYLGEPGYDSTTADKKPTLPTSKSSPMITIRFENGCVAQFRASGTEPKFKYYIEYKGQPGVSRDKVTEDLTIMSDMLIETLLEPDKHGLVRP